MTFEENLIFSFTFQKTGINLNHMLCAAESDPFQGQNYRIAAVIHESILCPILNKLTVYMFAVPGSIQHSNRLSGNKTSLKTQQQPQQYEKLTSKMTDSSTLLDSAKLDLQQKQQQHKPPTINNQLYLHNDGDDATMQLKHRNIPTTATTTTTTTSNDNSNSSSSNSNYPSSSHTPCDHPHHQSVLQQPETKDKKEEEEDDTDYVLEQDDGIEMVMSPVPATEEYRMPTTKID